MIRKLLFAFLSFGALPLQAQFFESFEGGIIPAGWHVSDNGVGTANSWTTMTYEGSTAAYVNRENIGAGNIAEDWLVTPGISLTGDSMLSFFSRQTIAGDQLTFYQVKVSTTSQFDHSTFVNIEGWSESDLNGSYNNNFGQEVISLEEYAGQTVYIAFVKSHHQLSLSLDGDRWMIDNVSVSGTAQPFNNINGNVSYGPNCDSAIPVHHIPITISATDDSATSFTNTGHYSLNSTSTSFNVTAVSNNAYYTITPPSYTIDFIGLGNSQTSNFCIVPSGVHPDLEIRIACYRTVSGQTASCSIGIRNNGTEVQSGSVTIQFNDDLLDFINSSPAFSSQGLNTVTIDFADLHPFERKSMGLRFYVHTTADSPPANPGDILTFTATINSGTDETPENNTATTNGIVRAQIIPGQSYDPNEKVVSEGATITPQQAEGYLHYLIHFQNIGTGPATKVVIRDWLENDLDPATVEVLDASHEFTSNLTDGRLEFRFDDIYLPPESVDEAASQGYVAFKIKPANTAIGTVITNNAGIYFDFNAPVITNVATTTITALGVDNFNLASTISLYPNPANGNFTLNVNDGISVETISIFNTLGQLVKKLPVAFEDNVMTADVSDLNSGTYFVQIVTDKGKTSKKLIKL